MTVAPEPRLPPIMVRFNDGLKEHVAAISNQHKEDVRGLPVSYSTAKIEEGLSELGLKLDQVRQLSNLKTKALIPGVATYLSESPGECQHLPGE
ncbi:hypothetical protein CEXT_742271 [Caerostris extrusa]|uniref:Uncharacterized protein n=1 Tax=Caerostris extrusa TaxID=172846 RepID=A0AAV4NSW6_CAEEX|nr:hypothetical protein CEXT_742271 [Caerostris extrusa]